MTTTVAPTIEATTPHWRGINHLALITTDMDKTVRFYHGTLGAQLVASLGTPEFRHYFFEFGPQCTVAFFEYTNAPTEPFTKAAGTPDPRAAQFDHLALNLPDEDALIDLQHRLKNADCEVTDIIDHGSVRSVYFTDPNPVPALQELQHTATSPTSQHAPHLTHPTRPEPHDPRADDPRTRIP